MAWREELHPRDARGRFTHKGSLPVVSIKATLANLPAATDDDLMDIYHRISSRKMLDKKSLAAIDAEFARREGVDQLPEPDPSPEEARLDELIARGYSYLDAYGEVSGRSTKRAAKQQADQLIDRQAGETLEHARRRAYKEAVALAALQAEEATRGNLTTHRCAKVKPAALWSASADRARNCASEELKRWWEANGGRMTYADFRAQLQGGGAVTRQRNRAAAAGAGRDFGL